MNASPFTPLEEYDRATWLDFIDRAPSYPLQAHPDVLGFSMAQRDDALVYADRVDGEVRTMAVLAPHRERAVDALPWVGGLSGWRLVGDRLAGRDDEAAHRRFVEACVSLLHDEDRDRIYFEDIEVDGALWRAAREFSGPATLDQPAAAQTHWRIHFPDDAETYWEGVAAKVRRNVRRNIKHFDHTVEVIESAQQVPSFLDAVRAISEQSWQGRRLGHGVSDDERDRGMFSAMADLGALRSYLLRHDGGPVAFVYGWQWGGVFDYARVGYDSAFAQKGPGKILLFRVLEELIADRTPSILDFGSGDADYKRRFGTHHALNGPLTLNSARLRTRIALGLQRGGNAIDAGARTTLRRIGLYDRVRRAYRRL